jgi:hypothetical protein
MFPCEMARYIAGFQPEARKYGRIFGLVDQRFRAASGQTRRIWPFNDQHRAPGGQLLAGAGRAAGGGAAIRGGGGGGAAIRGGGGGGAAILGGGGGAAIRGGGAGGAAILGGGDGAAILGGGGGGAAMRGGGADGAAILGGGDGAATLAGGGGAAILGGGADGATRAADGGGGRATCTADGGGVRRDSGCNSGFGLTAAAGLVGAAALGGGATTLDPSLDPSLGCWPAGAVAPTAGLAPVAEGAADPGGGPPGPGLAFGLTAALGGAGGVPLAPGTGRALVLGTGCCVDGSAAGAFAGCTAFGLPVCPAGVPGRPVLTAGLIVALGGTGALPCWISVARCATAGGSTGVALPCPGAATRSGVPGRPTGLPPGPAIPAPATGATGGRLITLLMTALLWMLA